MAAKETILVTGAEGFIGGRIVEVLSLKGSARVIAGIRKQSSGARIARFPAETVLCDIMNQGEIARAINGADVVIHCAYTDSSEVIIQGTKNLLEDALRQGVERFVYLSTAEVYGNVSGKIDESFPYGYTGSEYADSKIEAEKICFTFHTKGVPITILRPSIVYGPFSKVWTIALAARLQSGHWRIFENYGEGRCNCVYIDDLVSAILLAVKHKNAAGEAFNINGPDSITWNRYFQQFSEALGVQDLAEIPSARSIFKSTLMDRVKSFTGFFMDRFCDKIMDIYLRGGIAQRTMKTVKTYLDSTPSTRELQSLYNRDAFYMMSKARNLLGYRPKVDLGTGLRMSVLWLDHHGFLTQPNVTIAKGGHSGLPRRLQN